MNLLNITSGHCICKTNIGWIILDLRSKKIRIHQKEKTIEGDMNNPNSFPIELLTSENWIPIKDLDYFDIEPHLFNLHQIDYLEEKFGNYFKS